MYSTPAASICLRTSWMALSRPSWPMNASMSVVTDASPLVKAARSRPPADGILGHRPFESPPRGWSAIPPLARERPSVWVQGRRGGGGMFEKLLLAVDGSPGSEKAVGIAAEL